MDVNTALEFHSIPSNKLMNYDNHDITGTTTPTFYQVSTYDNYNFTTTPEFWPQHLAILIYDYYDFTTSLELSLDSIPTSDKLLKLWPSSQSLNQINTLPTGFLSFSSL